MQERRFRFVARNLSVILIFVGGFPLSSEEIPLFSEEFILLFSYLWKVFRLAGQEIPLCGEEFILHIQVCWTVRFLIARSVLVIFMLVRGPALAL